MILKQHFTARWDFTHRFIRDFQKLVTSLTSYIYIGFDDGEDRLANAKSIIGVFLLQIGNGMDFTIVVINDDIAMAENDMETIKQWFKAY